MKKLTPSLIFLLLSAGSFAQDTIRTYYDVSWKETSSSNAYYARKKFKKGNDWGVIDYYHSGKIQLEGFYSNDSCTIKNGAFNWLYENGKLSHTASYEKDKPTGIEMYYYDDGNKQVEANYTVGSTESDWVGYYRSGSISGKAHYKGDDQVAASFYNEDGSANISVKRFKQESEFPGGPVAWGRFLNENIVYPKKAIKNNIQGTVVVAFIVGADGTMSDISIAQSVDPLLDNEALRVVGKMPHWTPAIFAGRYVKSYKKQPLTFKFQ